MKQNRLAIAGLLILAALFISAPVSATPIWMTGVSSVYSTLLEEDSQYVELENVIVTKIRARQATPFFVVRDEYQTRETAEHNSIVVLLRAPVELKRGMKVSVSGTLSTIPGSGERCLLNAVVSVYVDSEGRVVNYPWIPFDGIAPWLTKQALEPPTTDIPPSDPSLASNDFGISGPVTVENTDVVQGFETVASLLATTPPVLSVAQIGAKPVVEVGNGYIVVGDDNSDATVKVYTRTRMKPGDRVIKLSGTTHSEDGRLVLYAGDGPAPFYDYQGTDAVGGVLSAKPGTVAYVSSLRDPIGGSDSGGVRTMSVGSSSTDGDWIYLTGMLMTTNGGQYYSYQLDGMLGAYYMKSLDMLPGIRVLGPSGYSPYYAGSVVDVMAKVDTKDGQRQLGIWNASAETMVDLTSANHSLEVNILATRTEQNPVLPTIAPFGMNNRTLARIIRDKSKRSTLCRSSH